MRANALIAVSLLCLTVTTARSQSPDPRFTSDGQLIRPENYREWIFLSSGLGMTYGTVNPSAEQRFDNVFVTPQAYRAFLETGRWPDKTMFVLEVRGSSTHGSINKGGHYQEGVVALEVHVKDEGRFPKKWAFYDLGTSAPSAKPFPPASTCQSCHEQHGAVDETFVQFYPTLIPVAKAKGTFKPKTEN